MEYLNNTEYEILTSEGFKNFDGVKISKSKTITLKFSDNTHLTCTKNHLILVNSVFIEATDLQIGCKIDEKILVDIIHNNEIIDVYDAINVEDIHHYITNDITSHNCAFIDNYDEFFASVFPTISSGSDTKIIMTSTPKGLNHFYKTIKLGKEGKNGYTVIEVPWHRVPGRDEAWRIATLQALNGDEEKFNQEFNIQFLGSSGTLIAGWKLQELTDQRPLVRNDDGLKQYELPKKNNKYVIVVDVARGKGLDYSAFSVINITDMPYNQSCVFRSNGILVADYADIIYQTAKLYNNAHILVEINDIGEQAAWALHNDFEYENILFTESHGRSGKRLSGGFGSSTKDYGIRTTKTIKMTGCSMLKMLIEQNQLIINDADTISELSTFSKNNNSYEAESGCNDDLVMGLVLFGWMTNQAYFKEINDINTLIKLREKTQDEISDNLIPFGFVSDGRSDEMIVAGNDVWLVENDVFINN